MSGIAGPEGAKNLAGECPSPDSDLFGNAEFEKNLVSSSNQFAATPSRRFEFGKRSQLSVRTNNEALAVIAMRVSNEDCLPVEIHR